MTPPGPQSPFPGMDPYLEDPAFWPEFHHRLLAVLQDLLRAGLAPGGYEVTFGRRRYQMAPSPGAEEHQEDYLEVRGQADHKLLTLLEVVSPANKNTATGREAYLAQIQKAK